MSGKEKGVTSSMKLVISGYLSKHEREKFILDREASTVTLQHNLCLWTHNCGEHYKQLLPLQGNT
jgi:hypothetical protein